MAAEQDIPAGKVYSSPGAAALSARETAPDVYNPSTGVGVAEQKRLDQRRAETAKAAEADAAKSPARREIDALNKPGSDLFSKDEAKQKAAMKRLRVLLAQDTAPEERQAVADMPVEQLREQYGIDHARVLAPLRASWDEHGEGVLLATLAQNGVEPAAVKELAALYTDTFNGALGKTSNLDVATVETKARAIFKRHGVSADVADAIVAHEKKRLGIGGGDA
jgi:hypothetical protein